MIKGIFNNRLQRHFYYQILPQLLRHVDLVGKDIPVSLSLNMKSSAVESMQQALADLGYYEVGKEIVSPFPNGGPTSYDDQGFNQF